MGTGIKDQWDHEETIVAACETVCIYDNNRCQAGSTQTLQSHI